ncbi:hypothetical protein [Streptomyces sp. NPDC000880]
MRTGMQKGAALGMAAVVVAMLLSGCGGNEESEEERTDKVLKGILKEYRPRYEERRTALAVAASHLPKGSPGKGACDREVDPRPTFLQYDHTDQILSNSPASQGGNVDIALASEADAPERIVDDPSWSLGRFALAPGWLIRGLWVTGPQGPLGTNHFEVDSQYAYQPYKGVEEDPAKRLRKVLDIGLHMRYALLYRVTAYNDPEARPGYDEEMARADVFLADLETGDIPCRLIATGRPLYVEGHWYSTTPYDDMQRSFGHDIRDKLSALTRNVNQAGPRPCPGADPSDPARCAQVINVDSGLALDMHSEPRYGSPPVANRYDNGQWLELTCWSTGDPDEDGHGHRYWMRVDSGIGDGYINDWYLDTGDPNTWKRQIPQC